MQRQVQAPANIVTPDADIERDFGSVNRGLRTPHAEMHCRARADTYDEPRDEEDSMEEDGSNGDEAQDDETNYSPTPTVDDSTRMANKHFMDTVRQAIAVQQQQQQQQQQQHQPPTKSMSRIQMLAYRKLEAQRQELKMKRKNP